MVSQGVEAAPAADVIAFVDESGQRGYLRDLKPASDDGVSVLCALPIPAGHVSQVREAIRPAYHLFYAAAPPEAKLHIADAFKPGNEAWARVARRVRADLFAYLTAAQFRVVYAARRLRTARQTFEMNQTYRQGLRDSRAARGPSNIRISGANRPSDEQVDDQLLKDLTLLMDAFMEDSGQERADFHFDEITDTAVDRFRALIQELRQTGDREHSTTFRDLTRGETFTRSARITTQCTSHPELRLNVRHVGEIEKVGKTDPLIFAVDVVTNHLWRHLDALAPTASLNDVSALADWPLAGITFCDPRPGASMLDKL